LEKSRYSRSLRLARVLTRREKLGKRKKKAKLFVGKVCLAFLTLIKVKLLRILRCRGRKKRKTTREVILTNTTTARRAKSKAMQ